MFTGIIEETGYIKGIKKGAKSAQLTIAAEMIFSQLSIGDSVATNGVCLTVTGISGSSFTADVMNETLSRSTLGSLTRGCRVNLERAMSANGRFGGHIVSGHIDGTGIIKHMHRDDIAVWYTVYTTPNIMRYIIEKGSVAIDGISLTVAKVSRDTFEVCVIPHTAEATTLGEKMPGSAVNLENDIIGKYVEKFTSPSSGLSKEFLLENGF